MVKNMKVINDPAERGIKFCSDFINILTKDEENRKSMLQAVEDHRRRVNAKRGKKLDFFNDI